VLYLRFFQDLTQAEIGNEIGVGQAQVSRIINQALDELRDTLTDVPRDGIPKDVPRPRRHT
jgi:RNA polymerase sigma-B factor